MDSVSDVVALNFTYYCYGDKGSESPSQCVKVLCSGYHIIVVFKNVRINRATN
jgi:hypothetical protein